MRQIFFLVLLFITTGLFAQAPANYTNINGRYRWIAGMFDSTFHIPKGTTTSLRTGGSTNAGALFYRTTDSSVYYYTGTQWLRVAGAAGFVPYTGATQNVNLGQFGLTTKFVQFDTSSQAVTDRRLQWSNAEGTLQFGMTNGATITQRVGLEQFARVRNLQGDTIEAGDVVYVSGASGDRAAVKLADNRADSTSSKTLGVATEQILPNDVGLVGTFGVVGKLNLSAFTAGDVVYLDSIPGKLTKVKPQAPYHMVFVGVVERANAGNGLLFVNVQNGYELEELHNVRITSPVRNNAILAYDSVGRLWKDTTLNAIGGITGSGTSGQVSYFNGTNSITSSPTFAFTPTSQLLVNNSVTAAGAIARGINATPSLTAAANNDVLVGLTINPTFTNGAFTGVTNLVLVANGDSRINGTLAGVTQYQTTGAIPQTHFLELVSSSSTNGYVNFRRTGGANGNYAYQLNNNTAYFSNNNSTGETSLFSGSGFFLNFYSGGTEAMRIFNSTRNVLIQNGGTFTDAGFRLDISGTARVQSFTTINAAPAANAESALLVQPTTNNSASAAALYGIYNNATVNTILSTSSFTGIYSRNAISATLVQAAGVQGDVNISAGTTTTALGFTCNSAVTGTGTANTFVGYNFTDVFKSGSGAIARLIGMRIMNLTAGSTANVGLLFNNAGNTSVNGTWDIYSQSGNASYLAGNLLLGTTSDIGGRLQVAGTITATSAIARGVNFTNTLVAAANNDVLVGLDINPTFTNGAFTGVTNYGIRTNAPIFANASGVSILMANSSGIRSNASTNGILYFDAASDLTGTINIRASTIALAAGTTTAQQINAQNILATTASPIIESRGTSIASFRINNTTSSSTWYFENNRNAPAGSLEISNSISNPTLTLFSTRNIAINSNTDAGFRLDVNGTARVQGNFTQTGVNTSSLGYIRNDGTLGLVSNPPSASFIGILIGSVSNGGHTAIFTKGNNPGSTAIRVTDQNIGASVNHFIVDYAGSSGFGLPNGTTTVAASAQVEIVSTTKGFLPPRMTTAQRDAISSPATGLSVYNTSTNTNDYYNGSAWLNVGQVLVPANNTTGFSISGSSLTGSNAQSLVSLSQTWNTTGNPTAFLLNITNTASGATADLMELQVGGVAQFIVGKSGTIQTTAPAGGTAKPWKLGNVAVVSPTSPDRTIEVEIDGVTYYIHAKTTNN